LHLPSQSSVLRKSNKNKLANSVNLLIKHSFETENWTTCILNFKKSLCHYDCIHEYLGYELDEKNVTNSICQLILLLDNEIYSNPDYRTNALKIVRIFLRNKSFFANDFVTELNEICEKYEKSCRNSIKSFNSKLASDFDYYIPEQSNHSSGFMSRSSQSMDSLIIIENLNKLEKNLNDKFSRLSLILDDFITKVDKKFGSIDSNISENLKSINDMKTKLSQSMKNIVFDEMVEF